MLSAMVHLSTLMGRRCKVVFCLPAFDWQGMRPKGRAQERAGDANSNANIGENQPQGEIVLGEGSHIVGKS